MKKAETKPTIKTNIMYSFEWRIVAISNHEPLRYGLAIYADVLLNLRGCWKERLRVKENIPFERNKENQMM